MNYDLAKRLKDAGFPQGGNGEWYCEGDSPAGGTRFELRDTQSPKSAEEQGYESVYVPTLSELIGACGYQFAGLERHSDATFYAYSKESGEPNNISLGLTPEEAVSELFIVLNEKV